MFYRDMFLANGESCDAVFADSSNTKGITDANNVTWLVNSGGHLRKNKEKDDSPQLAAGVKLLLYLNQTMYVQDYNDQWWKLINNSWINVTFWSSSLTATQSPECTLPLSGTYMSQCTRITPDLTESCSITFSDSFEIPIIV